MANLRLAALGPDDRDDVESRRRLRDAVAGEDCRPGPVVDRHGVGEGAVAVEDEGGRTGRRGPGHSGSRVGREGSDWGTCDGGG